MRTRRVTSLVVLDVDTECRPIAWYGGEFVTKQPTAIAWKIVGSRGRPHVRAIGESFDTRKVLDEEREMLEAFREAYDAADIVTGHFIREFDLPLLNGAAMRLGLPPLTSKLTIDTKLDAIKRHGLSMSQENLGEMFELKHPKFDMNTTKWSRANMLLPDGIELTKRRVADDVEQHIELFIAMRDRGLLRPPVRWTPA